ncbi:transposase [uncultured Oscillibacter sp.]|uniref:transposase n=1 Tax=uncultured Oscillibacter sp. TaxID=876091 RepID=UPI003445248A
MQLPKRTGNRGRPRKDDRDMRNGMLRIAHSGAQWRELPAAYGPPGGLCMPVLPNGG